MYRLGPCLLLNGLRRWRHDPVYHGKVFGLRKSSDGTRGRFSAVGLIIGIGR